MSDGSRRVRRWAGDRLRAVVGTATRQVAGDLHSQGDQTNALLSAVSAELAEMRRELTAHVAASHQLAASQEAHYRSLSQSLKYLAASSIGDRQDAAGQRDLSAYEMRVFSQNGEDGVLLEIVRRLGSGSRRFLEIGAQAAEANCIALAVLLGWEGTFIEADPQRAEEFRRSHGAHGRIAVVESFVTRENVNELLGSAPLDVLSLDIDGNDYWVWEALDSVAPRVVIVEYNAKLDPRRALVQPYDPQWVWRGDDAFGASRAAMVSLGGRKGYRLVHAEAAGVNLFFVREDLVADHFPDADQVPTRTPNYSLVADAHPPADSPFEYVDLDARD
jgi:hypothetical protein